MQQNIQAARIEVALQTTRYDAARVIRPLGLARLERHGQIDQRRFHAGNVTDLDRIFAVRRHVRRHDRIAIYGRGQNETVVVIGVFADDVDAARRGDNPVRLASIDFRKFLCDISGKFLQIGHRKQNAGMASFFQQIPIRRGCVILPGSSSARIPSPCGRW